jgi:magnesium transporter
LKKRHSAEATERRPLYSRPGAPPGTLNVHPDAQPSRIHIMAFGPDGYVEQDVEEVSDLPAYMERWPVTWVNVDGLGDRKLLEQLGELFRIHRLALEDVVNVTQRPKVDEFDEQLFIVIRMLVRQQALRGEQVSLFLGDGYVLTFQERSGDCLEPVRERIRKRRQRLTSSGADYLAYALLDAVVDNYFPLLEDVGEHLDGLQEQVIASPRQEHIQAIYGIRRDLIVMRRSIWPLRELFTSLERESMKQIREDTRKYLRDCYDHTVQATDLLEAAREMAASLMDFYLSSMGNRMNEIMKVLTIYAALFIPLTFIAGIYGMNFDPAASPWNMPELGWALGYPFALGLMAVVAVILLTYFRRKGWM